MTADPAANKKSAFDAAPPSQSGRLDEEQLALFDDLKKKFLANTSMPEQRVWYDDATLLRCLRARGWSVAKALKQLLATDEWRRQENVDHLYETIDVDEYEGAKDFCPKWSGRRDKAGRPLFVYKLGDVTKPATMQRLQQIPDKRQVELVTAMSEASSRYLFDLCSSLQDRTVSRPDQVGTSITCTATIIDLGGMPFSGFWGLRGLMQKATHINSSHHPETAYRLALVNAPYFFSAVWGWIKGYVDEGTRNKILVLSKGQMEDQLLSIVHSEDLPKMYGGTLDWDYSMVPHLDEHLSEALGGASAPPRGPWMWKDGEVILLGTIEGKPRGQAVEESKPVQDERKEGQ